MWQHSPEQLLFVVVLRHPPDQMFSYCTFDKLHFLFDEQLIHLQTHQCSRLDTDMTRAHDNWHQSVSVRLDSEAVSCHLRKVNAARVLAIRTLCSA